MKSGDSKGNQSIQNIVNSGGGSLRNSLNQSIEEFVVPDENQLTPSHISSVNFENNSKQL